MLPNHCFLKKYGFSLEKLVSGKGSLELNLFLITPDISSSKQSNIVYSSTF